MLTCVHWHMNINVAKYYTELYCTLNYCSLRVDVVINSIAFFLLGLETILCGLVVLNIFLASRKF